MHKQISSTTARPRLANAGALLGLALTTLSLGVPSAVIAQSGYSVQGGYGGAGMTPTRNAAYQQQGAPPAGSGLGSQPYYAPQAPAPRRTSPPAYQQQPVRQNYPAPQQPAYGQQQPYPYPAGAVQAPLYKPTSTKKKSSQPSQSGSVGYNEYLPPNPNGTTGSNSSTSQMRSDISDLKMKDREQDRRIAELENRLGGKIKNSSDSDGYTTYTVKSTDTLWRVADKYNTTPTKIKAANGMTNDIISPGQTLRIPSTRSSNNSSNNHSDNNKSAVHYVQSGETLSGIAASYHVTMSALQSANGIRNPNSINLNQRLVIPGRSTSTSPSYVYKKPSKKSTTSPKSSSTPRYVTTPKASEAQVVSYVPPAGSGTDFSGSITPPSGQRGIMSYRVEHGDTIDSVARSFNTTATEIQSMNKLPSSNLPAIGSEIIVPSTGPVSL